MTPTLLKRVAGCAAALTLTLGSAGAALAQTPTVDKGDTAFMFLSTIIVLLMTVPGLALFYGGLVRSKNMLSVLMQVLAITCMVSLIWVTYGYSMAFTNGGILNDYVGGFSKMFLAGVDATTLAATFSNGVYIPELSFVAFQMTFACITPALIIGSLAERVKFSAIMLFVALWVTFVYFPMAHMVWYWGGPDVFAEAAKAGEPKLSEVLNDAGLLFKWGAIDFAGGTVVHINAGVAGLVGALMIGKRVGYGREQMAPHSLTLTMVGAALLWFGWFGFNCGSNLEINATAAMAMINTFVATAAAGLSWIAVEWLVKGRPSLLGLASGVVAGLVAVTPAAGFAGPMGAIVLGFVAGAVCFMFCTGVKNLLRYDDSLDVFGVHAVGGMIGAIATGILVSPELGGSGLADYISKPGELAPGSYDMVTQVIIQAKAVGFTLLWTGILSAILFKIVDILIGLRPGTDYERQGLDIVDHGERAYNH
ncbi:MAG: ammonium transporter [Hyphomicrobium zavarzinii]|jgi:Amt family ammonium transporter|uniref:ammonium transporter n=1 Tax=Hyphomicrobium TaxID=81 RepID=UPI000375A620|nr:MULTISPECIES: ammonium transporter [Hyphomicrobium]MBL8846475.1 ammonium transporter [Hyphomicrobium zavarzinii]WBT38658.1 ammonium transporter [Hyphomicrobium sp. DMF-1]HML42475.1 ammonium transporter [Hyphomicrobium zavarzinii]